jgi:selenocysteine-specific elongation factor
VRVIATAGHVDHGKSALVTALTGIDPDRLPEEKARGMTLDLGFAWLDLGEAGVVGVVDVPGHERFVRHMLAGVGGIDAALLVVAADEGVMPQTREHLAILDLLGVRAAIVVLAKCDLVDHEWLALVVQETRGVLHGTTLAEAPIMSCSSRTGQGLTDLRTAIGKVLAEAAPRADRGRPRLPIDRVFSVAGHGTVVTGTLLDGVIEVGQEVEIAPVGLRYRIRALQSHQQSLDRAEPGRRIAINPAGAAREDMGRGMVVCLPGTLPAARYLDLRLRGVQEPPHGYGDRRPLLRHGQRVVLHTGAAEVQGTVRLLDVDSLAIRGQCWAQVRLDAPIAALRGDRCVLRVPSPAATVAGGEIITVNPPRRVRNRPHTIRLLERLAQATEAERLLDALDHGPASSSVLAVRADLRAEQAIAILAGLAQADRAITLATDRSDRSDRSVGRDIWATPVWLAQATQRMTALLNEYHKSYPLRRGMRTEAVQSALGLEPALWRVLATWCREKGIVNGDENLIWAPDHRVTLDPAQQAEATRFLARLGEKPYAPSENGADLDPDLLSALLERGDPVRLAPDVLIRREAYEAMSEAVLHTIDTTGMVTVGTIRDRFATSRKYAVALLEHLDDRRLTRRVGDSRVRGPSARPGGS